MLFFLYGEDSFRSLQKVNDIKKRFLITDPVGSGLSIFNWGQKENQATLLSTLAMPNLLAPKRLVIVRDFIECATDIEKDELIAYLKKSEKALMMDADLVLIFWEKGQPKKNGKIYKLLSKIAKVQDFEKLIGTKLNKWIVEKVQTENPDAGISPAALEKLIIFVGSDTSSLNQELQKLLDFSDGKIIQEQDVELLVKSNADSSIFSMMDALANNNKKEALQLLHEHLKKGEDAFYIFSMIIYQFRNLLKVADAKDQYHNDEYAIAKAMGLHPFVVKKSLQQLRNFPMMQLKNIYQYLGELDGQAKTGKIDIKLALDKFIVEL
ncbi:MAG: DNA polymerase III subunit delta [Parcubacteria group bacterium]|jgi:DNA polymerase-3 subunit delta